jgi:two-component system response regulator YesN
MKVRKNNIDQTIYSICLLIHKSSKLNLEFIGDNSTSSFELVSYQEPALLSKSKNKTFTYIYNFLESKSPSEVLYHTDNFQLNYLAVAYFQKSQYKGAIIVGPFISTIPDDSFISKVIEANHLSLVHRLQLNEYYKSLPIFDPNDSENVGNLMVNLASNPYIYGNMLFSQSEKSDLINKEKNILNEQELFSAIELRYKIEKDLLYAVANGLKEKALQYKNSFQFAAVHRIPNNPLRAYKNLTFSFNTLLRLASEHGGVSPIYIHNLSDKFAILIENIYSMAELEALQRKMISEYCDLANKFSTAGYSKIVKKAINYINLNFDNSLSLSIIAEKIDINPCHLSRQFKKETKMTITDFINERRIEEAKFLIEQNNNSITEIALMVGYENHNYFCKVFKRITSLTPMDYLKKTQLKNRKSGYPPFLNVRY